MQISITHEMRTMDCVEASNVTFGPKCNKGPKCNNF